MDLTTILRAVICTAIALSLSSAAIAQDALTLKERLSDKASDEQRVNNCQVPPERRGRVPRPGCPPKPIAPAPAGKAAAASGRDAR
jgi:hypothetical protein